MISIFLNFCHVLSGMLQTIENHDRFKLDTDFKELLGKELKRKGPIKPVEINNSPVSISMNPFKIHWDDLSIEHHNGIFELQFTLPETDHKCAFTLQSKSSIMKLNYIEKTNDVLGKMNYHSIPKTLLKGFFGVETIKGEAWIDHQWGDTGWFFSKDERLLGWDWFGINLEDGTDLMFIRHNDFNTGNVISEYCIAQFTNNTIKQYNNFELIKLGFWESPETRIKYPVRWKLKIEAIDLDLIFTPLLNEQEIHVPGYARAIWEGAGEVEGTCHGNKIKGRARGEFFGYGYIFDFKNYLNSYSQSVDSRIEEMFPQKFKTKDVAYFVGKPFWEYDAEIYTQMLSKPVWELIKRSGKRWRPVFGILMLEALGKPAKNYERLISIIELIHTGALIIDDIQDESPLRRGGESIHLKYGTDVAINAGNTLYFLPSKEIFGHEYMTQDQKYKVHEIMMNTYLQSHFGQASDIYWSNHLTRQNLDIWLSKSIIEQILQMYDYKTGAGAKGIAEVAAVVANAGKITSEICVNYARSFAVAFQIIDDIHNFSRSERWSKKSGEDLKNGKLTYVIAKALELLKKNDKERLLTIFCDPNIRNNNSSFKK